MCQSYGNVMKSRLSLPLQVALVLILGACSAGDNSQAAQGELEVITLQTTPSLTYWLPKIASCANSLPGIGVSTDILPVSELDISAADLTVRLGNPLDTDTFVTVLGTENLVIIAGPETPVTSLSKESLQAIFTGEISDWRDVPEASEAGLTGYTPITLLSYPSGNDLRSHFSAIYLDSNRLSESAMIFSTADTLTALLQENPTAITYALAGQVPPTAQVLPITGLDSGASQLYIIAISQSEPEGTVRSLLLCLQDGL